MIQVHDLTKSYGATTAVDHINFDVRKGEIFGLLGPNGAGKTTTLEMLEGLRRPDGGRIAIAGIDPTREPRKLRNTIGVQLQSSGMPESITPDEAMRLFCAYHQVAPRYDLLDRLGLEAKRKTQFHALSTGQQRRLALALAVAHEPAVLFLDEPTAGLDVASRVELHQMMAELRDSGTTIMLATHDMAEAEELCDRIAILLNGRLVTIGSPLDITATGSGLTKVSVRTTNGALHVEPNGIPAVERRIVKESYVVLFSHDIGQTVPAVIDAVTQSSDTLIDLRVERPSLEDRFLELTTPTVTK
jgi:ABC-2 type transport system ATP-binding protein